MRIGRTTTVLGTLLIVATGLFAFCAGSWLRSTDIPAFFSSHGQLLASAQVGGIQGWYLVDTGSARTLVTPDVASKLKATGKTARVTSGLSGDKAVEAIRVLSGAVRFASWRLRYPEEVLVLDLNPLATGLEHELDGILGWDVVKEYVLGFDLRAKQFFGGKTATVDDILRRFGCQGTATALPLGLVHDLPCVIGRSATQELKLTFDTGGSMTVLSGATWDRLQGESLKDAPEKVVLTITGDTSGQVANLKELRLGSVCLRDLTVMVKSVEPHAEGREQSFADVDGILGMDVLMRYVVVVDGLKGVVYLAERPHQDSYKPECGPHMP